MANIKDINWDIIRADYVMNPSYPSYDEICKKHNVSKPTLIAVANDTSNDMNRGLTWLQQRERHVKNKQDAQEKTAVSEAKKAIAVYVKVLNNIGLKAFKLIDRELDFLVEEQEIAIMKKEYFPIRKYVKISDITKIAEVLHKMSGAAGAKEMLVRLELAGKEAGKKDVNLHDLSNDEFEIVEEQVKQGGALPMIEHDEPDSNNDK